MSPSMMKARMRTPEGTGVDSWRIALLAAAALLPSPLLAAQAGGHPASEGIFLAQIISLILLGRLFGEFMQRIGQPVIMGQLIAGVLLGPSALGAILPDLQAMLFPGATDQKAMLNAVSQLGIILILLLTGMETDLALVRSSKRAALSVSIAGIAVPFASGVLVGQHMPEGLLVDPGKRFITSLFLGVALSISSVKIVALLVRELGFIRRKIGQVIIASAIIDDTIGWIIMSVIFGLALHGGVDLSNSMRSVFGTLAFLILSFTLGRRAVFLLIRWSNDRFRSELPVISMILIITGTMALITDAIGVHTVLGAFIAGVLIGQSSIMTRHIGEQLRGLIIAFFMPVFFGMAGLSADLRTLAHPDLLNLTLGLLAIASIGKFSGALIGGWAGGLTFAESLAVGCGMNARGSTEIIIATFGLSMGVLTQGVFTAIVAMAVVTTLTMPPMLRWAFKRLPIGDAERIRLEREDNEAKGFISKIERLLVAVDSSRSGQLTSHLVGLLAGLRGIPTTALHLNDESGKHPPAGEARAQRTSEVLAGAAESGRESSRTAGDEPAAAAKVDVDLRIEQREQGDAAIAEEAKKGFGALFIGREPTSEGGQFDAQITRSAQSFGGAVAIVSARGRHRKGGIDIALKILVPVTGTTVAKYGAELAIALAKASGGEASALHITGSAPKPRRSWNDRLGNALVPETLGGAAIREIVELGTSYGVAVQGIVRGRREARSAILHEVSNGGFNVVVLGVNPRPGEQLSFGDVAADLLEHCDCSLVFLTSEPVSLAAGKNDG